MVFKASKGERSYAIKTLAHPAERHPSRAEIRLFYHEAALLKQINHAQIPECLATFSLNSNHHFMVQEYIAGDPLSSLIMQGRLFTELEIKRLIFQLLTILHYLHEQLTIIHRDLRLSNLILNNGQLYLIDFGFARRYQHKDDLAIPDPPSRSASASYLALRRELSPHSDLFGAGIVGVDLMANWHDSIPYQGDNAHPFYIFLKKLFNPHNGFATASEALQALTTL